jgi:hypothetical protein
MLAESVVRSLIRLAVTLAILGGTYLLIVKPILNTTESTVNRAFDSADGFQDEINRSLQSAGLDGVTITDPDSIKGAIGNANLKPAIKNAPDKKTKALLRCVDRAGGDVSKIVACQEKFLK